MDTGHIKVDLLLSSSDGIVHHNDELTLWMDLEKADRKEDHKAEQTKRINIPWFRKNAETVIDDALSSSLPHSIVHNIVSPYYDPPIAIFVEKRLDLSARSKQVMPYEQVFCCYSHSSQAAWWFYILSICIILIGGPIVWALSHQTVNWDSFPLYRQQHLKFRLASKSTTHTGITMFATQLFSHNIPDVMSALPETNDPAFWIDDDMIDFNSTLHRMQMFQFQNEPHSEQCLPVVYESYSISFVITSYSGPQSSCLSCSPVEEEGTCFVSNLRLEQLSQVNIATTCDSGYQLCINGNCGVCRESALNISFPVTSDGNPEDVSQPFIQWRSVPECTSTQTINCDAVIKLQHARYNLSQGILIPGYRVDSKNGEWVVLVGNDKDDLAFRSRVETFIEFRSAALWFAGIWLPSLILVPWLGFIVYACIWIVPFCSMRRKVMRYPNTLYMSDEEKQCCFLWCQGIKFLPLNMKQNI